MRAITIAELAMFVAVRLGLNSVATDKVVKGLHAVLNDPTESMTIRCFNNQVRLYEDGAGFDPNVYGVIVRRLADVSDSDVEISALRCDD